MQFRFAISVITLIGVLVFSTAYTHAQTNPDLTITTIPTNPAPLSTAQLSVSSYTLDVNQATITWSYNGKVVASGTGKKTITVTTPNSGVIGTISVIAEAPGIDTASAVTTLNPASVDLLWEATDSYTPPFYKGKAKPATGAIIRVTAIPAYVAGKQLSYEWTHNGSAQQQNSGFGKNSITFKNNYLDDRETVSVDTKGGLFGGTGNTTLSIGDPSLVGYIKDNGFIDYANGGTSALTAKQSAITLRLEPFFFSINTVKDLQYTITDSDNTTVPTDNNTPNEVSFSKPDNNNQARFSFTINTVKYSLQQLRRLFTVNFSV